MTSPSAPARRKHTLPAFTPVPRLKERSNGWNPEVQLAFIEALASTGSVRAACRRVNRSECGAYQMRRHPEGRSFAKAWQAALALGVQKLEDIAMDRALNGVEVPVYAYGKIIGTRRVYNDKLLMFILRNRATERFPGGRGIKFDPADTRQLKRLKKQWHEEWARERAIEENTRAHERGKTMMSEMDRLYERWLSDMSPATREAYLAFRAAEDHDKETHYNWRTTLGMEERNQWIEETRKWIEEQMDRPRAKIYRMVDMRPHITEAIERDKAIKADRKARKKAAKEQEKQARIGGGG